jgi:hypothetical protein
MTTTTNRSLKGLSKLAAVVVATLALGAMPVSASEILGGAAWSEDALEVGADGQGHQASVRFFARITEEDQSHLRVEMIERDGDDGRGDVLAQIDVPVLARAGSKVEVTMEFTLRGSRGPEGALSAGTVSSITIVDSTDGSLLAELHEQPGLPIEGVDVDHTGSADEAIWEVQMAGDQLTASTVMQVIREGSPQFVRGDIDGDGRAGGVTDILTHLRFYFADGEEPDCLAATDVNGNGRLDALIDALYLINYSFRSGDAPSAPFPACGPDQSSEELGCERDCE